MLLVFVWSLTLCYHTQPFAGTASVAGLLPPAVGCPPPMGAVHSWAGRWVRHAGGLGGGGPLALCVCVFYILCAFCLSVFLQFCD